MGSVAVERLYVAYFHGLFSHGKRVLQLLQQKAPQKCFVLQTKARRTRHYSSSPVSPPTIYYLPQARFSTP